MGFYIRHCLGFFIQIFPCMILCFIPWDAGAYRVRRRWVLAGFTAGVSAMSLLFPVLILSIRTEEMKDMAANLYMTATILLCCFIYFYMIREHAIKKMLVVNLTIVYAAVQFMFVNLVRPVFAEPASYGVYSTGSFWMYVLSAAVMFPLVALMMHRTVRAYFRQTEVKAMGREFSRVFAMTFGFFFIIFLYNIAVEDSVSSEQFWWIVIPPFLYAVIFLMAVYWILLQEAVRRKSESDRRRCEELQKLQYQRIISDMEKTRRMRHDLRHTLQVLSNMASQGENDRIEGYISEMLDHTVRQESEWYCSNLTVNALLQNYIGRARDEGIACSVHAQCGEVPVSPVDLTVILGNALENAINACALTEKEPWIKVTVGVVGGSLAIQVENSCTGVVYAAKGYEDGSFYPADAFRSSRTGGGIGVHSIALAAGRYGGEAEFCYSAERKMFTTRVRMNLQLPDESS